MKKRPSWFAVTLVLLFCVAFFLPAEARAISPVTPVRTDVGKPDGNPPLRIWVLGDSITAGAGDLDDDGVRGDDLLLGFPHELARAIIAMQSRPCQVVIRSYPGGTIRTVFGLDGGGEWMAEACHDTGASCIVLQFGNNDCKVDYGQSSARVPLDEFRVYLQRAIDMALHAAHGITGQKRVIVLSPIRGQHNDIPYYDPQAAAGYAAAAREVVAEFGREDVAFVDVFTNMTPAMLQASSYLHPNLAGHTFMTAQILQQAGPLLAK